jgi:predicted transglutaminase-like cysteine proteinase
MVGAGLRRGCAAFLALVAMAGMSPAVPTEAASGAFAPTGRTALPPIGWVQFCQDEPITCDVENMRPLDVVLDSDRWRELIRVNNAVNKDVLPVTDEDQWGEVERWSFPTTGEGDCEDYVLEKRERLMALGWPRQALLVTVVRDRKGDGHAVLMVKTDRGDFVLDNQNPKVMSWNKTGYRYIKRQAQDNPNRWVSLGGIDTAVTAAK